MQAPPPTAPPDPPGEEITTTTLTPQRTQSPPDQGAASSNPSDTANPTTRATSGSWRTESTCRRTARSRSPHGSATREQPQHQASGAEHESRSGPRSRMQPIQTRVNTNPTDSPRHRNNCRAGAQRWVCDGNLECLQFLNNTIHRLLASPNSIEVPSPKNSGLSMPA